MGTWVEEMPKLGFGMMRLPKKDGVIDLEQTKEMVDRFLAAGFRYFDTAYGYEGSEEAIGKALVARYPRERFWLATKLPAWAGAKTAEEAKAMFTTSLARTGAGYFDSYLLHNLGDDRIAAFDRFGIWDYVLELREKGLVRHVGFSFHDKAEVLDELLDKHPEMEFVQLQINYADWESPSVQSRACYEVAQRHGKPVVIMEPVKGGLLANPPASVASLLRQADPEATPASWALRFAAGLENVVAVLSGMSSVEQMEDNLRTMSPLRPLSADEQEVIGAARAALAALPSVPCTGCQYCVKGCPQKINIPGIFTALNHKLIYDNLEFARNFYQFSTSRGGAAGDCIACGQCESVCPQHINIIERLRSAAEMFE